MENKNNETPKLVQNKKDKVVLVTMISGLLSGAMTIIITHPIDTNKAKVQTETIINWKNFSCIYLNNKIRMN